MILIGSRALAIQAPYLLNRNPKDFDWICTEDEFNKWLEKNSNKINPSQVIASDNKRVVLGDTNCEFSFIVPGESSDLLSSLVKEDSGTLETSFGLVPSVDLLFTIKSSHKYKKNSPHFWKNLSDYHMMKMVGATIRPEFVEFHNLREKETYKYSHPKLNQNKKEFFTDSISYKYDHDTIHESVATFDRPAYTYYIKDGNQVQCDKQKFFSLPKEIQIAGVVEESAVLAIERSLVPHPGVCTPKYAWKFALSKVCTSITSGWFREFAYENAIDIIKFYPDGYWEKFNKDVASGLVKPFES